MTALGFGHDADIPFWTFSDGTMTRINHEDVGELKYIGVEDYGFRGDNWFRKLTLKNSDRAKESLELSGTFRLSGETAA